MDKGLVPYHAGYLDSYGITEYDTYSDCFWYYVIHVMYLYFVFDICFMTNTYIINMFPHPWFYICMDTRKIKKWMNGWMNEPGFSPDTSVVPCQNLCTTDPNSFVHLSLALCTLSNWCHHSITHLKKEVFLCFYSVIVNCSLFAFHKSRLGYNPEDMDIVSYILSNII